MDRRLQLDQLLRQVLMSVDANYASHLYFQPPESIKLAYPCIVYTIERLEAKHANNLPYCINTRYQVTVIDHEPDSEITKQMAEQTTCRHERHFVSDNLYHDVFTIY